ncbi:MAG: hypothetical protein KDC54_04130, partial [Lewinella sp.]|nr:hypothetical protein [Lewinella sp.]
SFSANGEFTFTPTNGFSGAGGFTYTLTDACGNTAMATVVVNVLPLPCTFTANLAITAPNCGLNDGTASATVSEPGDYTYQWSDGQVGPVVSGLGPGDYSVTITQAGTGCMLEGAFTLEEMSPDYLGSVTIQHPTCVSGGQISFTASVPVADMVFVSVDGPDGTFNFLTPPGLIQLSDQIALPPGDYTIALQDPEIGPACQDVFTVTLDPPPAGPLIGLESIMPPSSPSGSDGSMTIVITAFNTPPFIVLLNGSQWGIVSNPVFTIGELAGGTYEVMLINALGCASNILMVDIPFTRPGWQLATDLMAPPVRWAGDGGVEHPLGEASWPVNGLGGSLAYKWASERRLQLSWWPSFAPAGGSLTGRFSWQQGWHRPRWSLHTGPAFYLTDQLPGGAGQWAWQNNLQWRLPDVHGWQLQGEWAFGRQENWWLAGQLGIRVRW